MDQYLSAEDDGLPMRDSGKWVTEKLDYLRRYLAIFGTSMRSKPWRARHYIDLFAGPGKCYVRQTNSVYLGSALLALTTAYPFTGYFFVDLDPNHMRVLQKRCSASALHDQIQYHEGDANVAVRGIVTQIKAVDREHLPGQWSSLNLAFLDPAGLDLRWETVSLLAELSRIDLIIHYPQGALNRTMPAASKSHRVTKVDVFFGGSEWRDIYALADGRAHATIHRQLMDLYKSKLRLLGYEETLRDDEVGDEPLMRNAERSAPLYRLLFASKHSLGHKFWQSVTRRNVYGQQTLF